MTEFKTLGGWCKWLEKNFSPEKMIPRLPVIIRIDGNNFSKWTKGLNKPFDDNLHKLMVETTKYCVQETNALMGYTQSDEITLLFYSDNKKKGIYHEGKKQKILSKLSSGLTIFFNDLRKEILPKHDRVAKFDCRIYQCPTLEDAIAQFIWRENDAVKNSKAGLAQSEFSHSRLQNLDGNQMQELLFQEKGINWNNLDAWKKRGTYIGKQIVKARLSAEQLKNLPPKHHAHKNPKMMVNRTILNVIDMPPINQVKNRVDVFFKGEKAIV